MAKPPERDLKAMKKPAAPFMGGCRLLYLFYD
jgi:hypothetical protein